MSLKSKWKLQHAMQHVNIASMLKTYLYLPETLDSKIVATAKSQNRSKAEIIRQAIEKGLSTMQQQSNAGVEALFKIAEIGRKAKLKGPKDGSINHDKYLWDKNWSRGNDE